MEDRFAMNSDCVISEPFTMMAKPVGSMCNLRCEYCYYIDKGSRLGHTGKTFMSEATLETYVRRYLQAHPAGSRVDFIWHGGEATLLPVEFYRKAIELQKKYSVNHDIHNSLQTNGTLLNDDWCRFLKHNDWLVGISVDGQMDFHDEYRRTAAGKGSFLKVLKGIRLLQRHGVEWNAMAVVNDYNSEHPIEFYRFFKDLGCHYIQFSPIVERAAADGTLATPQDRDVDMAPFSVNPEKWGAFLCSIFDEWIKEDVGRIYVQIFDATLANWVNAVPGVCNMAADCSSALVMEFNGDVYSCDHFVLKSHKIGNIHDSSIKEMVDSSQHRSFGRNKIEGLTEECLSCRWKFACNGGCPKDRFVPNRTKTGFVNYLCSGYKLFFEHVAPAMDYMKTELLNRRPPASIMKVYRQFV